MSIQIMLNTYCASQSKSSLHSGLRLALVPAMALAATLLASASHAQVTQITSAQFTPTSTANFGADPIGVVSNPYTVSTTGSSLTLTFTNNRTNANSNNLIRTDQQGGANPNANFAGDFTPDAHLLRNSVTGSGAANALTITFSSAVSAFGFQYDPTGFLTSSNFTFTVFQGAVGTVFTPPSVINRDNENGSAPFFGVRALGNTNSITSVQIFAVATSGNTAVNADDFAISPVGASVTAITPVPEPGAVALLAGALLPMGLLAARHRRR